MFSFKARKKQVDIWPHLRRIVDLTATVFPIPGESRTENRYNRTIPVLLCPLENGRPVEDRSEFVITRDICDRGVGVILNHSFDAEEAVVGFSVPSEGANEPLFFRGATQSNTAIGGGFWLLGVELQEFMNPDHREVLERLVPLTAELCPPLAPQPVG